MKQLMMIAAYFICISLNLSAQTEPTAGTWKTWFTDSAKEFSLPAPGDYKKEISEVLQLQKNIDSTDLYQIQYWNAGAPNYRWIPMVNKLWMSTPTADGILMQMLVHVAIYDATIAAWEAKYKHNRPRPFKTDKGITLYIPDPSSPSYPCEHSVSAGVVSTIISHFYPNMADTLTGLSAQLMKSRILAGAAFPSDTKAGFELGKIIAEKAIAKTADFTPKTPWQGKVPDQPGLWKGQPMLPDAGQCKTVVLDNAGHFRPGPPPDFAAEMEELRNFKPTFRSVGNAFHFAYQTEDILSKKIFEYNIHLNPPRAARMYALESIGMYDGFISCWDAKYTYWGIRPEQYDTTFKPVLFASPPFPGYPSGHAMLGAVNCELYSYFFPMDKAFFEKKAKDGAESRFHGGIHFRSDNEVALDMGKKVGELIVKKAKEDGADRTLLNSILIRESGLKGRK
jgi:membrane-associated phospholipid phosphatase